MVDVKVRLEVNPDSEIEKLGDLYVDNVNKVSNSSYKADSNCKYQNIENEESAGIEGLSFAKGYLVFNSDGYLANPDSKIGMLVSEQEPQEFVWGATDSNGYYDVTISFKNAANLDSVVFYGDKVSNQFPTIAYLDGSSYPISSDDSRLAIKFNEPSSEHSIRFTNWNRPNYNAVLTKITVMPRYWEIDKNTGLKSVESLSQSTGQPKEIFYGIVPSDGSIEILDIDGEIEEMVNSEVIPASNLPVEIFINEHKVQSHISIDSNYNTQSKMLIVPLENKLNSWHNVKFNGKSLYLVNSLLSILSSALVLVGFEEEMRKMATEQYTPYILSEEIIVGSKDNVYKTSVKNYINSIKNNFGYLYSESTNVQEVIDEICNIAQLNLIEKDDGKLKFVSARPIVDANAKIINLPLKTQISVPNREIFVKNKYNNVKINKNTLTHSFNPILDEQYNLIDKDGNLNYSQLGDDVRVIDDGENYCIGFFKTAITNGSLCRFDNAIYTTPTSVKGIDIELEFENMSMSSNKGGSGIATSNLRKEDFVFDKKTFADGVVRLTQYSTLTSETFAVGVRYPKYTPDGEPNILNKINILIYGNEYSVSSSESILNENSNIYELQFKEGLMTDSLRYGEESMYLYDIIANNIVNDYSKGITTANTSVVCCNYYDTNGNLAIDWSKGEILRVGDIIQLDKDNNGTSAINYQNGEPMRFKITGRTFRKEGVPLVDLELQEVKLVRV